MLNILKEKECYHHFSAAFPITSNGAAEVWTLMERH